MMQGSAEFSAPGWRETSLFLVIVGALAFGVYLAFGQAGAPPSDTQTLAQWVRISAVSLTAFAYLFPRVPPRFREWCALGSACLATVAVTSHLLRETHYSLGGTGADSGFIAQQLVKAKYYALPVEFFAHAAAADPLRRELSAAVVYGGSDSHQRSAGAVVAWSEIASWVRENVE